MRVMLIKSTTSQERNSDGAEVLRAGVIHNCRGLLSFFERSQLRKRKAGLSKIPAEWKTQDNCCRDYARNLTRIHDHLAMEIPLSLNRLILGPRQTIFRSKKILRVKTRINMQQVVETFHQQSGANQQDD